MTLRFLLVLVPGGAGHTSNAMPTYLNAMVAVGDCAGSRAAAKLVTLETVALHARRDIDWRGGHLFAIQQALLPAFACCCCSARSAASLSPLNALLQERGKHTVGAGNAIAVQNLGENVAMLLMLGLYSLAVSIGIPVVGVGLALAWCSPWRLLPCGFGDGVIISRRRRVAPVRATNRMNL